MPRRGTIKKRKAPVDTLYGSTVVARFINLFLRKGKKTIAEKVVYGTMEILKAKTKEDPLKVLEKALENIRPFLETKSRRVGGANYQVPIEVAARAVLLAGLPLAAEIRQGARRQEHAREALRRDHRRHQQPRRRGQEARRHAQDGGGQPGLRALQMVVSMREPGL